jgi:hypothetical protein
MKAKARKVNMESPEKEFCRRLEDMRAEVARLPRDDPERQFAVVTSKALEDCLRSLKDDPQEAAKMVKLLPIVERIFDAVTRLEAGDETGRKDLIKCARILRRKQEEDWEDE